MPSGKIQFASVNVNTLPSRVRRYHKRSRTGCDNCKRRRVKCNEHTPICGTCAKDGIKCTRTKLMPDRANKSQSSLALSKSSDAVDHSCPEEHRQIAAQLPLCNIDMLPLRLLYHFEHRTLDTLMLGSAVWKQILPLAFEHDFLMCAVFMIASAHLSSKALDSWHYKRLELQHSVKANAGIRQSLLAGVSKNDLEVLVATALLLYTQAWASPVQSCEIPQSSHHAPEMDFLIPLGMRLKCIINQTAFATYIYESHIFGPAVRVRPKLELLEAAHHFDFSQSLEEEFAREYQRIWHLDIHSDSTRFNLYMAECRRLLPVLSVLKLAEYGSNIDLHEGAIVRYLYSWPVFVTPEFAELIEQKAVCADLLFWHFYTTVQSSPASDYWWAYKRTVIMVETLSRKLQERGIRPQKIIQSAEERQALLFARQGEVR